MAADTSKDHQLTLKVMRLTKPTFNQEPFLPTEPADLCHNALQPETSTNSTSAWPLSSPMNQSLLLPQSFENIHLGETFSCYVCVHNDSSSLATEVVLKVDLQTSSQRVSLPSKFQDAHLELKPDETLGEIISHEVKEVGQHILVCAVSYVGVTAEKMYFRKFFKFPVAKPLDVKTKFYNAETDEVYLEAQVQNTTNFPMFVQRISLEPSDQYLSAELISVSSGETVFSGYSYMNPNDIRQYLYCLRPNFDCGTKTFKGVTNIGKLDMVWRTAMGERGRLQTSQLQRMVPGYGDLRLTVEEAPSTVRVQQSFSVSCRVINCSERPLDLMLLLDDSVNQTLVWLNKSNTSIGKLEPSHSMILCFQLLALAPGLQTISGIRLMDVFLNRTYEHDEVAHVFVYS